MAGSHEVRGSIPLGSTTDTRGARRRRRAPLFLLPGTEKKARGARLLLGVAAGRLALARLPWSLLVSFGGVGAGRRPFLVRPPRARGGRAGPVRAHRGDPRQGGDAFGAWPPRPRRARRGRLAQGRQPPEGGAKAVDGIGADSDSAAAGSRTPASTACRRRSTSGGPLPRGRPARRRRHRARQQGPEEGAHLSAGVRRPRPAPPRARPMRPAARRGDGASGAGLHGPRGVRERGIVPVKNAWLAVADPPPARTRPPPRRSRRRRRLIYKMVGMPTISLPASLGRLPRRRPKWANRGERPAPLPMRRKKRRERRNSYLANP